MTQPKTQNLGKTQNRLKGTIFSIQNSTVSETCCL